MKFILIGINAKYIHTALGVRSIEAYVKKHWSGNICSLEYTINQNTADIVTSLYSQKGDTYLFSCYIWNISFVKNIADQLSKIKPQAKIFFGGPEATYKASSLMDELPFLHGVILGEGEKTTLELCRTLSSKKPLESLSGILLKSGETSPQSPLNMDDLEFPYTDILSLKDQILYYESMRGCPFSCSYCLSSVEKGVRMRSVVLVIKDLKKFIAAKPRQLKFVDRTFNCNQSRAREIWQFLIDNDNQITNYHFELAGDLLDEDSIQLLSYAREGLFQFEIGIQSTNAETLSAIKRTTDLEKLKQNIIALKKSNNIHLHLDLIAGLPFEDFQSFVRSFHWVHALQPEQFQLGFLKVLGGSEMERKSGEYGLIYQSQPPFQILSTNWLSYQELVALGGVENMIDTYYNSGRFSLTISYLVSRFSSPFRFYQKLSEFYSCYKQNGPLSKIQYYDLLGEFAVANKLEITPELKERCRYDIILHEKPKKFPKWAEAFPSSQQKTLIWDFYQSSDNICAFLPSYIDKDPKPISRVTHLEFFSHIFCSQENQSVGILFDYSRRDFLGQSNTQIVLEL